MPNFPSLLEEEPTPENSDSNIIDKTAPTEVPADEVKPKQGEMVNFTKEVDYGVIDEVGNRIPCKSFVEAKMLSLLLELTGGKTNGKNSS